MQCAAGRSVSTNRGKLSCNVLITATGLLSEPLSEPKIPNLAGLDIRRATRRFRPAEYLMPEAATISTCGCSLR